MIDTGYLRLCIFLFLTFPADLYMRLVALLCGIGYDPKIERE